MFKRTSRQGDLFSGMQVMASSGRQRLKGSWAEGFRQRVLPVLLEVEVEFADLYSGDNGRPNWSVARMLGVHLLADMFDLDDQSALDSLAFDLRWQHALELGVDGGYLSRRSLVDFRSRLVALDPEMTRMRQVFDRIADSALADLGVSVAHQRLDSTRITSNIRVSGRIGLFRSTLELFGRWLRKAWPDKVAALSAPLREWLAADRNGWFGAGPDSEQRTKLAELASWLGEVEVVFANDRDVRSAEPYLLVVRLLDEHCKRVKPVALDVVSNSRDDIETCPEREAEQAAKPKAEQAGEPKAEQAAEREAEQAAEREAEQAGEREAEQVAEPKAEQVAEPKAEQVAEPKAEQAAEPEQASAPSIEQASNPQMEKCSTPAAAPESGTPTTGVELLAKPAVTGASLQSPHDPDAGCGHKGPGYHVHTTETCGPAKGADQPVARILTDYQVNPANRPDINQTIPVIERLAAAGRSPDLLFADGGYPTGDALLHAASHGVDLRAPVTRPRLPTDAIGREAFEFEPDGTVRSCPAGHAPVRHGHRSTRNAPNPTLHAYFDGDTCRSCPLKQRCIARAPNNGKKGHFHVELLERLRARDNAHHRQQTEAWRNDYRIRSGIEATMSELKRAHGLDRLRVRRRPRVEFAVASKLTACNIKRWLRATRPEWPRTTGAAWLRAAEAAYARVWRRLSTSMALIVAWCTLPASTEKTRWPQLARSTTP